MRELDSSILFIVIVLLAFSASRFLERFGDKISFLKGLTFAILGVVIGPKLGLGIIGTSTLEKLDLLNFFIFGLISFNIGLQFRDIKGKDILPYRVIFSSLLQTLIIAGIFYVVGLIYLSKKFKIWFFDYEAIQLLPQHESVVIFALSLGVISVFTSGVAHFFSKSDLKIESPVFDRITFLSNIFEMAGIVLASLIMYYLNFGLDISFDSFTKFAPIGLSYLLVAPLLGLLFIAFIGKEINEDRIMLATLGGILFATGLGSLIGHSALIFPFLMGLTISKFFPGTFTLGKILTSLEKPATLLIILLLSANLQRPTLMTIGLSIGYLGIRYFYHLYITQIFLGKEIQSVHLGLSKCGRGLMGQDALPLGAAIILSKTLGYWNDDLIFIIITGVVLNELFGAYTARSLLLDCDEIKG